MKLLANTLAYFFSRQRRRKERLNGVDTCTGLSMSADSLSPRRLRRQRLPVMLPFPFPLPCHSLKDGLYKRFKLRDLQ
jgi:hypothetical protein